MHAAYEKLLGGRQGAIGLLVLSLLLLVVFPLIFDSFRLNLVGTAITAIKVSDRL